MTEYLSPEELVAYTKTQTTESTARFVEMSLRELIDSDIELLLSPAPKVEDPDSEMLCSGWFCEEPKQFAVGVGVGVHDFERWFIIFAHEFNHFRQWKEEWPGWRAGILPDGRDVYEVWDEWLTGKIELKPELVREYLAISQDTEADCERRTLKMIIDEELPIDHKVYAQKSNSYIHFYNYIRDHRTWYVDPPYANEKVWGAFNDTIDDDFSHTPDKYTVLYEQYCTGDKS